MQVVHLAYKKSYNGVFIHVHGYGRSLACAMSRSKVQKEVITLYRAFLRASKGRKGVREHVQQVFRDNAAIDRTNVIQIDYLVRLGRRRLKLLQEDGNVTKISTQIPTKQIK